jgi:hypothetical protein
LLDYPGKLAFQSDQTQGKERPKSTAGAKFKPLTTSFAADPGFSLSEETQKTRHFPQIPESADAGAPVILKMQRAAVRMWRQR